MTLTETLKRWAVENLSVAADADDEQFEAALTKARAEGKLADDQYAEMARPESNAEETLSRLFAEANKPVIESLSKLADAISTFSRPETPTKKDENDNDDAAEQLRREAAEVAKAETARILGQTDDEFDSMPVMARAAAAGSKPRVKKAVERYSQDRKDVTFPMVRTAADGSQVRHPLAGRRAFGWAPDVNPQSGPEPLFIPSDAELAACGAALAAKLFGPSALRNDHERDLFLYAINEMKWVNGHENMGRGRKLNDAERHRMMHKTAGDYMIDDTTSGGSYAVPVPLDAYLWVLPILYAELLPYVTLRTATSSSVAGFYQGSRISPVGNTTEGTALSLESVSGLITNMDTTIFRVDSGVEIGLDWEADSPINWATEFARQFGEDIMNWCDNQIANGDGTTEPEGIFTKSGVTSVSSANGTSGPYAAGDVEELFFALPKEMRKSMGGRCRFVMNETAYRRYLSVPVGTADARRIFNPSATFTDYTLGGHPVSIEHNINDAYSAFCNLAYYVMYRRQGVEIRVTDAGYNLHLRHTKLITAHARFGGQVTLPSSVAKCTDGDSTDG